MKRVLFLSFAYPYGHFGPSDNCTVRVMEALVRTGEFEVWNLSYKPKCENAKSNYRIIDGVKLLFLPFSERQIHHSRVIEHLLLLLKIPIYPFYNPRSIWKHYKSSKEIIKDNRFDLVISQCFPQESVMCGSLLKRYGFINKLLVLFWDNIYGKYPRRIVPKRFAMRRSRIVENWIASLSDILVSPIPVKSFHDQHGDVNAAKGKRIYLGHPSIIRPNVADSSLSRSLFKEGMINLIYAGRFYNIDDIVYAINLLNSTSCAERINLVFISFREPTEKELSKMCQGFKGNINFYGSLPFDDLLGLYAKADGFLGFAAANSSQVISKIYDYMCFGKPIIYFYKDDDDVNVQAFFKYPLFTSVDVRISLSGQRYINGILSSITTASVPYEEVERLFYDATGLAYVKVITEMTQ